MSRATTVDDVFEALLERIGTGTLALGSKLPSCRALADEFDSNPTTVNRALGRLAATGLVRIESRRGTFIAATEPSESMSWSHIRHQLEQVVERARSAGISREQLAGLFDEALTAPAAPPRVAFVECNEADVKEMANVVEHATGVTFERVLLYDLTKKSALRYDAIAAPIFHLSDVYAIVGTLHRVIELNFVPSGELLRQLASIDPDLTLGVATSLSRGIDRLSSLARQYFSGDVRGVLTGSGPVDLDGIDVLLVTSATELSADEARSVPRIVKIDWELEHASGATFEQRLRALLTPAAA